MNNGLDNAHEVIVLEALLEEGGLEVGPLLISGRDVLLVCFAHAVAGHGAAAHADAEPFVIFGAGDGVLRGSCLV